MIRLFWISLAIFAAFTNLIAQTNFWYPSNKGIENVSINSIKISDNGTILAQRNCLFLNREANSQIATLFRSRDEGKSWQNITTNIPSYNQNSLQRVLYGLYVTDNIFFVKMEVGSNQVILRSNDLGETWENISEKFKSNNSHLLLTVGDDNNLYVLKSTDSSIWKSEDNGDSWENVFSDSPYKIATIYIGKEGFIIALLREGIIQNPTKVIKIVDGNAYASKIDTKAFSKQMNPFIDQLKITRTGIRKAENSDDLYACFMLNYGSFTELFRSKDKGENWQCISKDNIHDLFHVTKDNRIYATAFHMPQYKNNEHLSIRSDDGGKSWEPLLGHPGGISAFTAHPDGSLLIGTSKGIYKSKKVSVVPQLYGTTVITHGFQLFGKAPPWTLDMAKAILEKARGKGCIRVYDKKSGRFKKIIGTDCSKGENILLFNWAAESNEILETHGYSEAASDALFASLLLGKKKGDFNLEKLHFIGHSRGCVVNTGCTERLLAIGINIDHITHLDPHDWGVNTGAIRIVDDFDVYPELPQISGINGSHQAVITWEGVEFCDTYYQTNGQEVADDCGNCFFNGPLEGRKVAGAFNEKWNYYDQNKLCHSNLHSCGYLETIYKPNRIPQKGGYRYARLSGGITSREQPTFGFKVKPDFDFYKTYNLTSEGKDIKRIRGIVNGSFDRGSQSSIPGWEEHGGEISSDVSVLNDQLLMKHYNANIGNNKPALIKHNRFYIPKDAETIIFLQKPFSSNAGVLDVYISDSHVYRDILQGINQPFKERSIDVSSYQDQIVTLELQFKSISGNTKIIIDNFRLSKEKVISNIEAVSQSNDVDDPPNTIREKVGIDNGSFETLEGWEHSGGDVKIENETVYLKPKKKKVPVILKHSSFQIPEDSQVLKFSLQKEKVTKADIKVNIIDITSGTIETIYSESIRINPLEKLNEGLDKLNQSLESGTLDSFNKKFKPIVINDISKHRGKIVELEFIYLPLNNNKHKIYIDNVELEN